MATSSTKTNTPKSTKTNTPRSTKTNTPRSTKTNTPRSTKTNTAAPDLEAATERARETNERFAEVGRKVTGAYLDGVEKYVSGIAQVERRIGKQSHVEAVASLFDTHAKLTEDVTKASVAAARELVTA